MNRDLLRVYVILDPSHCAGRPLDQVARQAVEGGATLLQLRAEGCSTYEQVLLGTRLRIVSRELGVPLVINDRLDVAQAVQADGVHVGHPGVDDMPPDIARALLGPRAIVGVSVATPEEAVGAARLGASYLSVGPIFATSSKGDAGPVVGPGRLRAVRGASDLPLCAIGGITASSAAEAVRAGADGVAVLSAVCAAPDPAHSARELAGEVVRALAERVAHSE